MRLDWPSNDTAIHFTGSSAGLTVKALYGLMVSRERIRQEFKHDGPAEFEVPSFVDPTHDLCRTSLG
jgi:hypothetical protein